MVRLVSAECPDCGATVELPGHMERARCAYCGNVVVLSEITGRGGEEARNLMELGRRSHAAGDFEAAIRHFERALELDSGDPRVNALLQKSCLAMATKLLNQAREYSDSFRGDIAGRLREEAKGFLMKGGVCPHCHGYKWCPKCRGSTWCERCGGDGKVELFVTCPECGGFRICRMCRGWRYCVYCRGTGQFPPPR